MAIMGLCERMGCFLCSAMTRLFRIIVIMLHEAGSSCRL